MSRIVEERGDETRTEISLTAGDVKNGTKILEDTPTEGETKIHNVMRPTTVVTENNIYMLLTKSSAEGQTAGKEGNSLLFVSGTLSGAGDGTKKQVAWSDTRVVTLPSTLTYLKELVTSGGSGIAMEKDNRVAFPIQATKGGKNVLLVMHGSVKDTKWKLSTEVDAEGCSDPAIVEWEEGNKFLMIAPCAKGSYDVYRSTELGNGWLHTGVPLTRVWGTSRTRSGSGVRSGFITTTIEGRKVLLVTLPVYSENGKGRLHLFLTDNAHVYDVGPVSPEGDDAAASNLLYTNDNRLIVVYEKKNSDASTTVTLVSVHLTEQLEQIRSVVQTWDEVDKSLKLCTSDNSKLCSGGVPTEGLAGFLSGTLTDNVWKDEYLCVNATVKGAKKTETGLKFEGTGAGAEWPVGKLGQNQPYYFANNEFTLVATVTIHRVPTAGSTYPLIGVKMNDTANTVLFGLSYSHEKKWVPLFNNEKRESESADTWEKGKEYQVALTMKGSEWSVYIDGKEIYGDEEEEEEEHKLDSLFTSHRISHFYIGGYGDVSQGAAENRHVTVTNVMLYNRLLTTEELGKLDGNKVSIPRPVAEKPSPSSEKPNTPNISPKPADGIVSSVPETPPAEPESKPDKGVSGEKQTGTSTNQVPDVKPQASTVNGGTVKEERNTQNDVKDSGKHAPGEDVSPQGEEKEEKNPDEPHIAGGRNEEGKRPKPEPAEEEEEHDGTRKNNTALPPAPVNGVGLNNTGQQPGSQEAKPSGANPSPSNSSTNTYMQRSNGIGDGAVPACVSHGVLFLMLLGLFGIWDFVLRHPL